MHWNENYGKLKIRGFLDNEYKVFMSVLVFRKLMGGYVNKVGKKSSRPKVLLFLLVTKNLKCELLNTN